MTALPHPVLDERLRENFEYIASQDPKRYVYKEFNKDSMGYVFTLPIDAIILFGSILFVTDPFDSGTQIKVGEVDDNGSLFSAIIDVGGKVPQITVGNLDSNITTKNTLIYLGFVGNTPTKGKGWFLVSYLLKNRLV